MASERVALYARQSVQEDQGITQQLEAMRKRAIAEDWIVAGEYVDNFTSATKARGDGTDWARMLADADAGKIDTIVAVKSARLLRRVEDALEVTAPRRDVRVVTFDGIDTAGHWGKVILLIMTSIAEAEIEEKEARALPFRAARREAGHPTPGLVPYGYNWVSNKDRDDRGTRYQVVPHEAHALLYMSRELRAGAKLGEIAKALNDGTAHDEDGDSLSEQTRLTRPILNRDGTVKRPGAKWTSTTVRRILLSPFPAALLPPPMPDGMPYRADRFTLSECTPGAWDAILTEDAVAAARGRLLDSSRRTHDGNTRAKWLLSGLGECGRCGGALRKCQTKTTATSVRGYRCTTGCFQRPAALIEEYVENAAVEVLSAPGLLAWVDDRRHDIGALRARRDAIDADEKEWFARVQAGTLRPEQWDVLSTKWAEERTQLDGDIAEAVSVDPTAAFVGAEDVRGLWERMSTARRRAVLGALLLGVQVHPVGKGRRLTSIEAVEGTVTIMWRRAERRVKIDAERTVSSVRGRVPDDARDAVGRALDS
ncbi:recombinase family protein [Microbacterium trichothecenolyticum]|uniref:Site-specific DNA recombinase n=1 Tax=Microbacterium trichothecenolyticum TaxID=69370 RepID=A0ABU0TZD6_MICTR|nr:recombinase family protein [Microbacterium trichothecenolyticum]MDQ1124875.1 site-specific DNA recombinase [Microbacterium trichothecenolyticum]